MKIQITGRDIIWSYAGYFFNLCTGVLLLPFTIKYVSSDALGLWYTFLSIGTLVSLLDFGFSNTLVRNVTYAWSGIKELKKEGYDVLQEKDGMPNYHLLISVFIAAKRICLIIAAAALLILLSAGSFYIRYVSREIADTNYMAAWMIFSLAVFFNIYYNYWTSSLKGIGAIKQAQKSIILSKLIQILFSIAGLLLGYGILALAVSYLISGFILRLLSKYYLYKYGEMSQHFKESKGSIQSEEIFKILKIVWHNAKKTGLVSLGAFLITQSTTMICSAFLGLQETASYGLSLQIINVLIGVSATYFQVMVPMMTELKVSNKREDLIKILSKSFTAYWILYVLGFFALLTAGIPLIKLLKSDTELPFGLLLFMGIYLFLENNHSLFATYISLSNKIPYVTSSLISGAAIILLSVLTATTTKWGIYGLMLTQCIVQLCYNNWKWPFAVMKELHINPWKILQTGINEFWISFKKIGKKAEKV